MLMPKPMTKEMIGSILRTMSSDEVLRLIQRLPDVDAAEVSKKYRASLKSLKDAEDEVIRIKGKSVDALGEMTKDICSEWEASEIEKAMKESERY